MPSDDEIRDLLKNPGYSNWMRVALNLALERDPVDAANDAALLAMVLERRADRIAAEAMAQLVLEKAKKNPA